MLPRIIIACAALLSFSAPATAGFYEGLVAAQNEDWETALSEWLLIAKEGNPGAQSNLGDMYANGLGVEEDQAEALRWHKLAADQGIPKSTLFVGLAYASGEGVDKDTMKGGTWLLIGKRLGNKDASRAYSFVRVQMSPEQEAEAQALADAWQPKLRQ